MEKLPFWLRIMMYYLVALILTGALSVLQGFVDVRGEFIQLPQVGPALAAIIFLALEGNSIKAFLIKGFRFRLDRFTFITILTLVIFTISISVLTTSLWGIENIRSSSMNIMSLFLIFSTILAAMCEEIGWRGYMLPKLQSRMTPARASIVIGILWGFWHIPKLFMGLQFFSIWLIGMIGLSFVHTYAFNRTGGNIWAVTFIHSSVNLVAYFFLFGYVTDIRVVIINSIAYLLWAAGMVRFGKQSRSKKDSRTISSDY